MHFSHEVWGKFGTRAITLHARFVSCLDCVRGKLGDTLLPVCMCRVCAKADVVVVSMVEEGVQLL
jgi:hypothetical protein